MDKKTNDNKIEREYIIPLREKGRVVPIYKKTPKAIRTIKEFLVKHMKIRDRDLKKIKIDSYLNDAMWSRGIKNPPHKIKVKAIKEGDIVRVELVDFSDKIKFKKLRKEKVEEKGKEIAEGKKKILEKEKEESEKIKEEKKETDVEEKAEKRQKEELLATSSASIQSKENKSSLVEAGKEMGKAAAKQMKHQVGGKKKEPKINRVALQK